MTKRGEEPQRKKVKVIHLRDLAPRGDVVGGANKLVFGQRTSDEQIAPDRTTSPKIVRPRS